MAFTPLGQTNNFKPLGTKTATPPTQGSFLGNLAKGTFNAVSNVGKGIGGAVVNTGLGLGNLFFKGAEGVGNLIGDPQGAQFAREAGQQNQNLQNTIKGLPGMNTLSGKVGGLVGDLAVLGEGTPFVNAGKGITEGLGKIGGLTKLADTGKLGKGVAYVTQKVLNALPEATLGFGYGKVQGQTNKEALGTGTTFGVLSGLGEVVGDSWKAFKGNLADNTSKALGMTGKMNATQAINKVPQSINALKVISNLAPDIKVLDDAGVEKTFMPAKATFYETAQAWTKARDMVYNAYTDLAKQAGDTGASFTPTDLNSATKVLEDAKKNATSAFRSKADSLINDLKVNFGVDTKGGKMLMKNIPLDQMQSFVEKLNTDINPLSDKAGSQVSATLSQKIREIMDKKITESTGEGYQKLRNSYRDLKSIEGDLVNQFKKASRGTKGFGSYIEGFGALDVVLAALHGNIAGATKGAGLAGLGAAMKYLRDPEVNLRRAFQEIGTESNAQSALKTRMLGGATPTDITNPLKDIPNKQGGFVKSPFSQGEIPTTKPYKETGNLTTKILKDLEGKTTVSKQYILDATNRGELKQVERDLVRSVLEGEKDTINVADFAKKVKAELLPLEIRTPEDFNPRLDKAGENYHPKGGGTPLYESITLPDEIRGKVKNYTEHVFESPVETSAGRTHFSRGNEEPQNYFGHTRIEDMADNKTRRVIEVQSDLYQKGKLDFEGAQAREIKSNPTYAPENRKNFTNPEAHDMINSEADRRLKEVSKLEQYNDPTAHFRMIREEIKKAAQDGKTKLQFPTGETAMKIEGLGQGDSSRWMYDNGNGGLGSYSKLTPDKLKVGMEIADDNIGAGTTDSDWIITDVLGDGKFKAVPKQQWDNVQKGTNALGKKVDSSQLERIKETFDISGKVDTNNPIYKFYEKDIQKYLNKFGGKKVVDDKGVSWIEIPINKAQAKTPVEAFGKASIGTLIGGAALAGAGAIASIPSKTTYTNQTKPTQTIEPKKLGETLLQLESSGGKNKSSADKGEKKWLVGLTDVAIKDLKNNGLLRKDFNKNKKEHIIDAGVKFFNLLQKRNPKLTPAEIYVDKYWSGWKNMKNPKQIRQKKIDEFNKLIGSTKLLAEAQ